QRAIKNKVAFDGSEALRPKRRHEHLPLLDGDLGIASTLENQVAAQYAVLERTAEVRVGFPLIMGTEELERCERRDELHHRCGVVRPIHLLSEERPALGDVLYDDADRIERNAGVE